MKLITQRMLSIPLFALITSCGGGGGNSNSTPPIANNSSAQQLSSSSSSAAAQNSHPEVNIIFPQTNVAVTSNKITVRGHAADANGIKSIKVNGVIASISSTSNLSTTGGLAAPQMQKLNNNAIFTAALDTAEATANVEWQATLDVPLGHTNIEVVVEDNLGNSETDPSNPVSLQNLRLPTTLLKDNAHNRWVGVGNFDLDSVAVDMSTKQFTNLTALSEAMHTRSLDTHTPESLVIDGTGTTIYSSSILSDNPSTLSIYKTDVASAVVGKITDFNINLDLSKYIFANVSAATVDQQNNAYYILVNFFTPTSMGRSQVFKFDITSNKLTSVYDTETDTTLSTDIRDITYSNGSLYLLKSGNSEQIFTLALATGAITKLVDLNTIVSLKIAIDEASKYAYVAGILDVAKIDIQNLTATYISPEADQQDINFPQPVELVVDEEHGKLLIGDAFMADIFTVDIETGERGIFAETGIGEGSKLGSPTHLTLTSDKKTAYVLDARVNAKPTIFKVDLATGSREKLLTLDPTLNLGYWFSSITLDEENHNLYISIDKNIIILDTMTGTYSILENLATDDGVMLTTIGSLLFDSEAQLIYIATSDTQILFTLDVTTKKITIAKDLTNTEGPDMTGVIDIIKGTTDNSLFALNRAQGKIYSVDIPSGKKVLLLDTCLDIFGRNVMSPMYSSLMNIDFNRNTQTLVFQESNYFYTFDMEQKTCTVNGYRATDAIFLNDSSMVVTAQNEIRQLDLKTGEQAVLSR